MSILIAFVDNNNGISFNNRPVSSDCIAFNKAQTVSENLMSDDVTIHISGMVDKTKWNEIDTVILYRWNRAYPHDARFVWPPDKTFILESFENFKGNSHDVITEEVYRLVEE